MRQYSFFRSLMSFLTDVGRAYDKWTTAGARCPFIEIFLSQTKS